jgi:hypothetical protein
MAKLAVACPVLGLREMRWHKRLHDDSAADQDAPVRLLLTWLSWQWPTHAWLLRYCYTTTMIDIVSPIEMVQEPACTLVGLIKSAKNLHD